MSDPVRVLVFAYHNVGCACLQVLLDRGVEVVAVVTHEDRPDEHIWFSSVAALARDRGIPVHTPAQVRDPGFAAWVRERKPDLIFSFYYRLMLPAEILEVPRLGAFNMHGSLLPRYRGRCPVNWVLVNGESETGVTLHRMAPRADRGAIVGQTRIPIGPDETARELFEKITRAAAELTDRFLPLLCEGRAPERPQDEAQASYFGGRSPEDGRIDWTWEAVRIHNLIRAVTHPYPGAFTRLGGRRILIWRARAVDREHTAPPGSVLSVAPLLVAAGRGVLEPLRLQPEGEEEMEAPGLVRSLDLSPGARFET